MTIKAKFASRCAECKTPIAVDEKCLWVRGTKGVRCVDSAACATRKAALSAAPAPTFRDMTRVIGFLKAAEAKGLKAPKVRFIAPGGGELMLALTPAGRKFAGSMIVKVNGRYLGAVNPRGEVFGALASNAAVLDALDRIADDPAKAASEYGILNGRCGFCYLELSDEGSLEVGYGPICAAKYGLPHTPKGRPESNVMTGASF